MMTASPYAPIACGLHENYQFAVMKQALLDLRWREADERIREARVMPRDVFTLEGAEYLQAEDSDGTSYTIRLDRIDEARWARDGVSLDPAD
ncbi:MAG: hypothetical protein ABW076_13905 [Candidatus Thiodiazotropha sp.]